MPKKYFEWTSLYNNPDINDLDPFIIIEEIQMENDLLEPDLSEGQVIDNWSTSNHAFFSEKGPLLDCLVQAGDIKIISEKCKSILETMCPAEIQFLPITLIYEKNSVYKIEGYYVVNNLVLLECIDYGKTEHKYDEEYDGISLSTPKSRLYIFDNIARNYGIFRLKKNSITTVLREDVAMALKESKITGLGLREIHVS